MPNYVSLTESQRRSIALFVVESQQQQEQQMLQQMQMLKQQQSLSQSNSTQQEDGFTQANSTDGTSTSTNNNADAEPKPSPSYGNLVPCKEIVQFCKARFGLTISLSTASRLRSSASKRLATELVNPSAKRTRQVKYPEFEKALLLELKALEDEQLQIQQEQERISRETGRPVSINPEGIPPVMMLSSEAAITQVAKGIAEKMGIKLGMTSGWYAGFRKRHGIKHKPLRSRSNTNLTMLDTGGTGTGLSAASDVPDVGSTEDGGDGGDDVGMNIEPADDGIELAQMPGFDDTASSNMSGITMGKDASAPHRESSTGSSLSTPTVASTGFPTFRRPVKRATAAAANDALDVISEYLLQNSALGASQIPLVKELRNYLLAQAVAESQASALTQSNNLFETAIPLLPPLFTAPVPVSAVHQQQCSGILLSAPSMVPENFGSAASQDAAFQDPVNQLDQLHLTIQKSVQDTANNGPNDPSTSEASILLGLGLGPQH
ncbi:hypothetical protein BGZ94_002006 [Podila epigama]|nr:hypothetical protein BGZ94_002006 [Podila epigama]